MGKDPDSGRPYHLIAAEGHLHELREKAGRQLTQAIQQRRWTQTQAARYLEVSQPRMSDLMRGKTEKFSLDTLVKMAFALDRSVRLEIAQEPYQRSRSLHDEAILQEARDKVEYYTRLLQDEPDNPLFHSRRAWAHHLLGNWEQALADYDRCLQLEPDRPGPYMNRILSLRHSGRLHEALEACHDYERRFPEDGIHQNRALIYMDLGLWTEAERDLNAAVARDPNRPGPWTNRAYYYRQQGRLQEALADYRQALEVDPTSDKLRSSVQELQELLEL